MSARRAARADPWTLIRRVLIETMARLPWGLGGTILGLLGIGYGLVKRDRWCALDWASCQPLSTSQRWRVTLGLLANAARYRGAEAVLIAGPASTIRRRLVLEGAVHLQSALREGGTILLGFHLGPPIARLALWIHGYRMAQAGRYSDPVSWPLRKAAWARFLEPGDDPFIRWPDAESRILGLYRLQHILQTGRAVALTADGLGAEAFRISLPGRDMVIRAGWMALRRSTRASTLPLLAHREGTRIVVTIYPPLPAPDPDRAADAAACKAVLSRILRDYVRRFPTECCTLALGRDMVDSVSARSSVHVTPTCPSAGALDR